LHLVGHHLQLVFCLFINKMCW